MEMRVLGRTGLAVSAVGMGGIPIQRVDFALASKVVETAAGQGVNFIDTARAYTDSEAKIGQVLSRLNKRVVIATKSMARSRDDMAADIELSLQHLQVKCIDLYQLHNVKDEGTLERVLAPDGALQALKEAREAGKIRFIGITGHIPAILVQAVKTGEFDTVQFPFNPVETGGGAELLPLARAMNLGTIAMKPFAGGAIKNTTLSLRYILEQGFTTVIPGMDSPDQVPQNAAVGKDPRLLTPDERALLEAEAAALGRTFCRRCEYCRPCPQGIDIPMVFLLDGYWTRYGLKEWATDRYQPLPAKASDCMECGECEARCPYGLPIRQMLQAAAGHLERGE